MPEPEGPADRGYDVAIVGARVAGAVLAAFLGRAGLRVLLLDAGRFPSDTVSTHFFRGGAFLEVLRGTEGLERVLALGSPPLVREYLYEDGAANPVEGPPQSPGTIGFNLSVRRVTLDAALVRVASESPGVELLTSTRAVALHQRDGRVVGLGLETPDGPRTVAASVVVGADGRSSWLARAVGAPTQQSEAGHRGMYYAYFAGFPPVSNRADAAEFSTHGDEIAYVFPSDGSLACIALSLNLPTFRWAQAAPWERYLERLRTHHPGIGARLHGARAVGSLKGAGPAPNFVRCPYGPGWALVGDSEMHQDPFSGQGIDSAALHARALAREVTRCLESGEPWEVAGARYARERDAASLAIYEGTVRASRDLTAG